MHFFGESILDQENESNHRERRGPQNLLDLLPNEFTRQEVQELRQRMGIRTGNINNMLSNWKSRGYIESLTDALTTAVEMRNYRKTEMYLGKYKGLN